MFITPYHVFFVALRLPSFVTNFKDPKILAKIPFFFRKNESILAAGEHLGRERCIRFNNLLNKILRF